jgi:hypothetical protein
MFEDGQQLLRQPLLFIGDGAPEAGFCVLAQDGSTS